MDMDTTTKDPESDPTAPFKSFDYWLKYWRGGIEFGVNFVIAVILFLFFYILVRLVLHLVRGVLRNPVLKVQEDVVNFLVMALNSFLWVQLAPIIVGQLGIPVEPIISVITVVIFGVGIALMPAIENFVAGVMLHWLTPFSRGDVVHLGVRGTTGTIVSTKTSFTEVAQPDGTTVYVPNTDVYRNPIHNHTQEGRARIDAHLPLPAHTTVQGLVKARQVMLAAIELDDVVLKEPAPVMVVKALSEVHVVVAARVWVRPCYYYTAEQRMLEVVRAAFVLNDIEMSQTRFELPVTSSKSAGEEEDDHAEGAIVAIAAGALVATTAV